MNVIAITQARSGSTRLPEKIFKEIQGKTMLEIHLSRLMKVKRLSGIIVATTVAEPDHRVCELADKLNLQWYCGSENDVLDRFYQACKDKSPDYIVRVTSDCPLIDPELIDRVIETAIDQKADYCSNVLTETFPDGQDIEVFTFRALQKAWKEASLPSDREHVTPYMRKNCDLQGGSIFRGFNVAADGNYSDVRMTVDEAPDFEVIRDLVTQLGKDKSWKEYAAFIRSNRTLAEKNAHIMRNEGYLKSLRNEKNE